jgi:hypothetical protein
MSNTLKFGNGEWYGKKDTILAYNDENRNFKPLPFDFSRESSATVINKDGLIETVGSGQPRIDYKDDSKGALLLEPSRTNKVTYSEDYNNSNWTTLASGETIVSNSIISPDGTLNADTLEGDGTGTAVYVRQDVSLNTSVDYTFSIFAKKGTNDFIAISAEGFSGATNTLLIFDLNNSIVTNGTGNIENYGNGWLRCSFTIPISTDGTGRFLIYPAYNGTTRGFPTSSDANGQNIYIYGAQAEQGSYATSYIPTSGSAVTRLTDSCSQTVPDGVIGQTEGTIYAELGNIPSQAIDDVFIELSDGTSNNRILFYADSNGYIKNQIKASGSISSLINTNVTVSSNMKIAITYKSNEAKVFINGVQYGGTDTSVVVPSVNKMNLESYTGTRGETSTLKDVKLYNTALTDQELKKLTQV